MGIFVPYFHIITRKWHLYQIYYFYRAVVLLCKCSTTDLDKSPQCYEEANILTRK